MKENFIKFMKSHEDTLRGLAAAFLVSFIFIAYQWHVMNKEPDVTPTVISTPTSGRHGYLKAGESPADCYVFSKFVEAKGHDFWEKSALVSAAEKNGDCVWKHDD